MRKPITSVAACETQVRSDCLFMNIVVSCVTVLVVLAIHDRALVYSSRWVRGLPIAGLRPSLCVLAALVAHHLEVLVFAVGWMVLLDAGQISFTPDTTRFFDVLYFSGAVYTSLGFGDIMPEGPGRLFAVTEAISGLVLIAWTASFTFLQMQRNWRER